MDIDKEFIPVDEVPEEPAVTEIVGVRFRTTGKIYYFAPGESKFAEGDNVIVGPVRGVEYGTIAIPHKTLQE